MSASWLLLGAVFAPFVAALLAPLAGRLLGARSGYLLAPAFLPGLALAAVAGRFEPLGASLNWVPGLDLAITLRADGFSLLFALIVSAIGLLVVVYAAAYLGPGERHGRFFSYLLLFGGAMLGLVLSDNLLVLFAFWELTSISSYLLIGFWDSRKASQDGAEKALLVTTLGGLALLVAVVLLILGGGSVNLSALDLAALRESPLFVPALALLLVAAFTKSAQLPFHLWLPTAMEAPTPVSAYLHSATMVKAGVFLVAKFGVLFAGTVFTPLIVLLGLATMFWGGYLALRQNDLKALLAYSTVSQLGLLMSLYGAGYPFAATLHLVNHAAFKAALFLVVGVIDHQAGSRDITRLSGLRRKLPLSFALALPAALSMAGLPPLGGFLSKELFYEGMFELGSLPMLITVAGSILTFAYSLRFLKVFFGPLRNANPNLREAPAGLLVPILPLSAAALLFGLWPASGGALARLAAPALGGGTEGLALWHGLSVVLALSVLTWFFGLALHNVRDRVAALQERLEPGWNVNSLYYAALERLERLAGVVTDWTQGASFSQQLRLLWLPVLLAGAGAGWRYWPTTLSPVPLPFWTVGFLAFCAIAGVLTSRTRLSMLIFAGLAGIASTLAFVLLAAPDLALTQLLIETVTVILFLSVFRYLPVLRRYRRSRVEAAGDALLALGVGATVFTGLVAVQTPIAARLKDSFLEFSKELGGGDNVVNVILVDFRGYDTMGEITVLAIVGVSVYALLKIALRPAPREREEQSGEGRGGEAAPEGVRR